MKKIQDTRTRARPGATALKPEVVPLDGTLLRAVHALAAGLRYHTSAWPEEDDAGWPVYESGTRLARAILGTAFPAADAPGDGELARAADEHHARVRELAWEWDDEMPPLDDFAPTDDDLGMTTAALREQALDHHTAEVIVGTHASGGRVLVTYPRTAAQAHVWLLGPLYEKLESWAQRSLLASVERAACMWWFSRWRSPRPLPGDDFAGGVREQEFAFVDRPMLALGMPPLEHLVRSGLLRGVGARQRHLAAQLARSEAGVWVVDSRTDGRAVFVSPLDGRRYEVLEHAGMGDTPYGPDFVALGRLIPFGDGTWLRSPGTFLMNYGDDSRSLARTLAEGLETGRGGLPMPAAMELAAHKLYGVPGLPRAVPPAPTPDDAAEAGRDLSMLLRASGLARPADLTTSPLAAARQPNTEIVEYQLDIVLAEFMQALVQQSQKSRLVRQARRRRDRQLQKKKGRRRR